MLAGALALSVFPTEMSYASGAHNLPGMTLDYQLSMLVCYICVYPDRACLIMQFSASCTHNQPSVNKPSINTNTSISSNNLVQDKKTAQSADLNFRVRRDC